MCVTLAFVVVVACCRCCWWCYFLSFFPYLFTAVLHSQSQAVCIYISCEWQWGGCWEGAGVGGGDLERRRVEQHKRVKSWSSLDIGESLACQMTSPFNKNIGCFERRSFKFYLKNNPAYCWMGKLSGKPTTPLYLKSSMVKWIFICWLDSSSALLLLLCTKTRNKF